VKPSYNGTASDKNFFRSKKVPYNNTSPLSSDPIQFSAKEMFPFGYAQVPFN